MPQKQPKRGRLWLNEGSYIRLRPERKNHVWSYDLMAARTQDGRVLDYLIHHIPSIDGITLKQDYSVDGIEYNDYMKAIERLEEITFE